MKNLGLWFSQRLAEEVEIEQWKLEDGLWDTMCARNAYNKNRTCHQEQLILDSIIKSLLCA